MCLWQCYMGILYYWWEILQAARNWIRVSHRMSILGPCIHEAGNRHTSWGWSLKKYNFNWFWLSWLSHRFAFDEAGNASHPYKSKRWLLLKWKVASSMDLFLHFGSRASTKLWIKVRHTVREILSNLLELHTFPAYFKSIKCLMKIVLWMSPGWGL